jgi:hypothetical protein
MDITPRHRDAEARFRRLVEDAGLEPPDAVTYEHESVTFFWTGPRVAVIVDLDDAEAPVVADASGPGSC